MAGALALDDLGLRPGQEGLVFEAAAAALSLGRGVLTPTINYEHPDPECDVDVVANQPRKRSVNACLKLSYGFGGHNACLVITRV